MRYKAKRDFDILDTMFIKDDEIFIGESQYVMNGIIDYGRKVFNSQRGYLGMIRDSYFYEKIKHLVDKV